MSVLQKLVKHMKELESSLWYKTNIEEADRALWNVISQKTNMKRNLVQTNWLNLRCQYNLVQTNWLNLRCQYVQDRQEELINPCGKRTAFLQLFGEHLDFLESNVEGWIKLLSDGTAKRTNQQDVDTQIKKEDSDSTSGSSTTTNNQSNNFNNVEKVQGLIPLTGRKTETTSETDAYGSCETNTNEDLVSIAGTSTITNDSSNILNDDKYQSTTEINEIIKAGAKRSAIHLCQSDDSNFIKLVENKLLEMDSAKKRRVKDEILNILL